MTLRMIDTFSGIGGFSLAARWLGGIETVQFVEREPFCQRVLAKHWPEVPIHDDICTYAPAAGAADLIVGGFPCQDISQAGAGAGIREGTRSGLFYELMRVVRLVGPRFVVLENVAAITHRGLDIVFGELAEAGFDAEWACIKASDVGACHQRDRWWCVAYPQGERWGAGPRQGQAQGGREGPGAGDGAQGLTAHAQGQHRHDGGPADPAEPAGATAEPGNGDGADAPDSDICSGVVRRKQLPRGKAPGEHGQRSEDPAEHPCGIHGASSQADAAHPLRQRLEGRHQLGGGGQTWPAAPARLSPDWTGYASQPVIRRGDDGFSGRVDRLKALGNAVVPQVAMIPLARVLELAQ
jgi:site-specific DNA-cytosine methylase